MARLSGHPTLIRSIVSSLRTDNYKLRIQLVELLTALDTLTATAETRPVLDGFADATHVFGEDHRFAWLVESLEWRDPLEKEHSWDWRCAVMTLLHGMISATPGLEERCSLRGELHRRGLMRALEVSGAPRGNVHTDRQALLKAQSCTAPFRQLAQIYMEEQEEDMAELRMLNVGEADTAVHAACNLLIRACSASSELSPVIVDIVQSCGEILCREDDR